MGFKYKKFIDRILLSLTGDGFAGCVEGNATIVPHFGQ
jgi:hypothetical protein